jgi:hypothetical protein
MAHYAKDAFQYSMISLGHKDSLNILAALRKTIKPAEWQNVEHQLPFMRIDPLKVDAALGRINAK